MGIFTKLLKTTLYGSAAVTAGWVVGTRNSKFVPFDPADPILSSKEFKKYNPDNNSTTKDVCIKRVEIGKIRPELLEKAADGKLAEAFCAGVWSGIGMYNSIIS
jgi:hypothetical protein